MNIVVINHYAGSEQMGMEYRPFYLAREWVEAGHNVTIIAATWSHLRARQPAVERDLGVTEEAGVRFRWLRTNRYQGNGIARILNMAAFISKLRFYADTIAREEAPDAVVCSSTYPLDIYPGERLARKARARLIFEVHDLWPLTPMLLGGYSEHHPYIRILQRAEDHAYRTAAAVVSILPNALEHMVTRGLARGKFVHIPNGVPVARMQVGSDCRLPDRVETLIARERHLGHFLVGFAGSLNATSTDLDTLLEAAGRLLPDGVSFLVAGDGPHASALHERALARGADNFHLLGHLPKSSIQGFLSRVDVLTVTLHKSPLYRFGISLNKLFDYMLAGKPIVQASGSSNDVISEADCGLTVPPGDAAAVAEAILRLRTLPQAERRRLGENGRSFVLEHHDYRFLARRFLHVISGHEPNRAVGHGQAPRRLASPFPL